MYVRMVVIVVVVAIDIGCRWSPGVVQRPPALAACHVVNQYSCKDFSEIIPNVLTSESELTLENPRQHPITFTLHSTPPSDIHYTTTPLT